MRILLTAINAKYIHSNLAVYSLKANAKEWEADVELAEFTINNQKDDILEELYRRQPQVLCFSCYIWNLDYVEEISREFHKLCPDVPIWVGGPEVSYEVEAFLKENPHITGVMIGEGEETFREVCQHYIRKELELKDIHGLGFREGEKVIFTPSRSLMDMSKIPFCYDQMQDFSNRIIYYESSRGCPFSCSYCLSSVEKKLRFRDLSLVKQELQFFIDQKVPQIKFVDRTFNCHHDHAMEIWKYIKDHDNGVTNFHFEVSADLINEDELQLMETMRPGLIQLEIGVQSTNEITIKEIHRTMKLDRLKEVVRRVQSMGNIHQHLDLIAGLPYEDYETFQRSFDEIYTLKPNQLQLGFLKVLKGSYMYDHAAEYEIVYHDRPPYEVLSTKWLSYSDVLAIKQVEEMLEVYYNSGQFEVTMKLLEKLFDSAFIMFLRLGEFYQKRGYFGMSHSRIRRCEILLEFLEDSNFMGIQGLEEMIKEALIFDLYYRENCKSRPEWACSMTEFKHMTRFFCPKGKMSHVEPFHYHFPEKDQWSIDTLPKRQEKPLWVLFHYDRRDPLDHQAEIEYVQEETWQQSEQKKS
ncbi:MAG: B12-binding domain-containing radical SAM protein [Agathobacter sp.]|nr:B12-binding domain-containing radical SAM protein [Agathobacter sp.]